MLLLFKIVAVLALSAGSGLLCDALGIDSPVVPGMVFFGAVSFFLGPYATGSGFYARGAIYVDRETPEVVWRFFGVVLWIAAVVTMGAMWHAKGS